MKILDGYDIDSEEIKKKGIIYLVSILFLFLISLFLVESLIWIFGNDLNPIAIIIGSEKIGVSFAGIIKNGLMNGEAIKIAICITISSAIGINIFINNIDVNGHLGLHGNKEQKNIVGDGERGSAKFQTEKEKESNIKNFLYTGKDEEVPKSGGIALGMEKIKKNKKWAEKIFYEDDDIHTLGIGTTRSGKGRTIIFQSIWLIGKIGESMILSDPKGELFKVTSPFLKLMGYDIKLINFADLLCSDRWNILDTVTKALDEGKEDKALDNSRNIAKILCSKGEKSSGDPLWYESAVNTIQSLILYVCTESKEEDQKHMGSVYALLLEKGALIEDEEGNQYSELGRLIGELPLDHLAKKPFGLKRLAGGGNTESSINVSSAGYIQMFNSDTAIKLTSKQTFDFEDIGNRKTAVFLKIPHATESYNELASLFIEQSYSSLIESADKRGGRLKTRVNYILDEFGNLPPVPRFAQKVTIAGGYGIKFSVFVQSLGQIEKKYKDDYATLISNFHNTLYILASDSKTNKEISETLGKYTRLMKTYQVSQDGNKDKLSVTFNKEARSLLDPDELSKFKYGEMLLMQLRKNPSMMKTPDIACYKANQEFGLAPSTGDTSFDKEENRKILEEREKLYNKYRYKEEEINYFLAQTDEEIEMEKERKRTLIKKSDKDKKEEESKITQDVIENISENEGTSFFASMEKMKKNYNQIANSFNFKEEKHNSFVENEEGDIKEMINQKEFLFEREEGPKITEESEDKKEFLFGNEEESKVTDEKDSEDLTEMVSEDIEEKIVLEEADFDFSNMSFEADEEE
jgi:type IV secretion system protein VirD4